MPRLNLHTVAKLRKRVISALERSRRSKCATLWGVSPTLSDLVGSAESDPGASGGGGGGMVDVPRRRRRHVDGNDGGGGGVGGGGGSSSDSSGAGAEDVQLIVDTNRVCKLEKK